MIVVRSLLVAVLMVSISPASVAGAERGELCINGELCVQSGCGERVAQAAMRRPFTLTTRDAVILGVLEPDDTRIACDGYLSLPVRLVAPGFPRGGTVRVSIAAESGSSWSARLGQTALLRLRRGTYDMSIEAPHYIRFRKKIVAGDPGEPLSIALERLPQLSGIVVANKTGQPIAGASITSDTTDAWHTDASGRFAIEADPERWPSKFTVSASGFAERPIVLPRARVSATLNDIRLAAGGVVSVEVSGSRPREGVSADLEKFVEGRVQGIPYQHRALDAGTTFTDVEPGAYVVVVKGPAPCQRRSELVVVREGEQARVAIDIKPVHLHIAALLAGAPLPHANVILRNGDAHWQTELTTDDSGEATAELWQGGKTTAWVANKSAMTISYRDDRDLSDSGDTDWTIDIPQREISGTVVDSSTGDPIPSAAVVLHVMGTETGFGVDVKADEHGRFRFMPVTYGAHVLKAAARDYTQSELHYTFSEPEQRRELTIRLDPAAMVRLTIRDPRGQPLSEARAMQFRAQQMISSSTSRADGTVDIAVPREQVSDVYVVARDGSFAFAQLQPDGPQTITVPDGVSRIVIRAESDSHAPIAGMFAVVRYNGRTIPSEVIRAFAAQGSQVASGEDGRIVLQHMPAGAYEFWPVESPRELDSLVAQMNAGPPVKMTVTAGENVAVLTFTRDTRYP